MGRGANPATLRLQTLLPFPGNRDHKIRDVQDGVTWGRAPALAGSLTDGCFGGFCFVLFF